MYLFISEKINIGHYWGLKVITFYEITKIVHTLRLAKSRVCMRVCKHGCDVKVFCSSRTNHAMMNLKKFLR